MDEPYSKEERARDLAYVEDLKAEVGDLYKRLFTLNVGGRFHAFLEWCGVMGEHLNICEDMIKQGLPAFDMNRHTGQTPPIPPYRLSYMGEKLECIFDGLLTVDAKGDAGDGDPRPSNHAKRAYNAIDDLSSLPRRAQTQRALDDQLRDLSVIANRLGMYDAADHLRRKLER